MESLDQDKSFILYSVKSYDAISFTVKISEVKEEEFYGINAACDAISSQHELCLEHPASCQSAKLSIGNFEETIKIRTHSLVNLKRVCELPESVRCNNIPMQSRLDMEPRGGCYKEIFLLHINV